MAELRNLYVRTRDTARQSALITELFRIYNLDAGVREYQSFLRSFQEVAGALLGDDGTLAGQGIGAAPDYIVEIMRGLLGAQEQKDYVLLADLLALQVQPFLQELLGQLRTAAEGELLPDYSKQNLAALAERDPVLARRLDGLREPGGSGRPKESDGSGGAAQGAWQDLYIEETSAGYPTCRVERGGASFYLHSNQDPYAEARAWARTLPDEQASGYHILGAGLGYHVLALYEELRECYPVHVYEADIRFFRLTLRYLDLTKALRTGMIVFHEDAGFRMLAGAAAQPGQKLCIHYPSMRLIRDERLRQSFEQFFLQDSSYRNAKMLLQGNFDANMESMRAEPQRFLTADALRGQFHHKTAVIVAAGPSLDKNAAQLITCAQREDCVLVACGTVFRKLLGMGIRPDYVMVTDANPRVLFQIYAQENNDVPMLMLSTANHGFAARYAAVHYMLFQEGYPRAEREAEKRGCMCVKTGGSVMTTALDTVIRLGAERLVFVGLDLAFTDNLAHASETSNRVATDTADLTAVKAWGGGTVYADQKFILYRTWMERRLQEADAAGLDVVNATEGGSFIQGMRHIPLAEALKETR
ncbi:MAG: DUF115 domain-containing protein [Clostridium sp.]|nr:DUF115 domain-containing protein [Clostridium sp.]